jgi:hypothetical protein
MAAENKDIRMGTDVVSARKVKAGTQVTMGIGGDAISQMLSGELSYCLIVFNNKDFAEVKAAMEKEAGS